MSIVPTASPQHAAANAICASLHRAYRDLRFYPPDHPSARQSVENLSALVQRYVDKWGGLTLDIGEEHLFLEGEVVYSHGESRDNLAFLMFRDGLRALTLHPGIEAAEIEGLVDCLAHADDLARLEYDMVTAFWEQDFIHVDYRAADPFLGGEVLREGMVDALRETVLRRLEDGAVPRGPVEKQEWGDLIEVRPQNIDRAALALSPEEVEYGERAVEGLTGVVDDFADVLLELAANAPIRSDDDVLVKSFPPVVAAYIDADQVGKASFLLERLRHMETQGWCPPGVVGKVVSESVDEARLSRLLQRARQSPPDEVRQLEGFIRTIGLWVQGPLLAILAETEDRAVRKSVLGMLEGEGGIPWSSLEPLLRDPRWYVVRNAVQLAGAGRHVELAEHCQRLLAHPDVRVRREMLRALERLGGTAAAKGFAAALTDNDSSARTLAARGLEKVGASEAEAALLIQIEDRGFHLRPEEEVRAFLEAYGALAQERALPLLEKWWRKKLLASRPPACRVAAVLALGQIRGPRAHAQLLEASKSGEAIIQRAAHQALQLQASQTSKGAS